MRHWNTQNEHNGWGFPFPFRWRLSPADHEMCQRETLQYALLLDKLDHASSIIIEQLQQNISKSLSNVVSKQFFNWLKTQKEIDQLRESLAAECSPRDFFNCNVKKNMSTLSRI